MELSARDLIKPNLRMFQQFLQFLNRAASEATKESPSDGSSGSKRGVWSASLGSRYAGRARSNDAGEFTSASTRSVRFASSDEAGEGNSVEYACREESFEGDS